MCLLFLLEARIDEVVTFIPHNREGVARSNGILSLLSGMSVIRELPGTDRLLRIDSNNQMILVSMLNGSGNIINNINNSTTSNMNSNSTITTLGTCKAGRQYPR